MRLFLTSAVSAIILATAPAAAETNAETGTSAASVSVEAGASVYGSDGNAVGTVSAVQDGTVLIDTGTHKIPVSGAALRSGEKGATVNITQAELNAQYEQQVAQQAAKLEEALVVGVAVKTADEQPLGTVQAIEGDNVVITTEPGPLRVAKESFAIDQAGTPVVLATMAQIQQAISGAPAGR